MNEHADYDEFVVQIGPRNDAWYPVTVLRSPAGTGGNGRFPVRDFLHDTTAPTIASAENGPARGFTEDAEGLPLPSEVIGRSLFDALFTGEVLALFERSLGRASAQNRRLRIRLHLNVENASIAPLARLPWELMFRQDRRAFLALSPDTTFVRSLDVPIDAYDLKIIRGPVMVLFVMSNPRGDLNLAAERIAIEQQIAEEAENVKNDDGGPSLVAEFLEQATFAALEEKLHRRDYHIIHFMGHGATSADGEGQLLFHDGVRSGRDFGELLKNEPMIRLVTLNACNTAATSIATGADPFAGVATALVIAGVPAVIAMQFPVSDSAAIAFSARLYSEIGMGRSIEASVDSGRRKIKALRPGQHEWATPVLFLRDPALSSAFRSQDADARRVRERTPAPTGDVIAPRGFVATPKPVMPVTATAVPAAVVATVATQPVAPTPRDSPATVPLERTPSAPSPKKSGTTMRVGIGVAAAVALLLAAKFGAGGKAAAPATTDTTTVADDSARRAVTEADTIARAPRRRQTENDAAAPAVDSAATPPHQAEPDPESEPVARYHFPRRGVNVDVLSTELTGVSGEKPSVAAETELHVTVHYRVTRSAEGASQCSGECPVRLYLLVVPITPKHGNLTCLPSVIEDTTDGGVRTSTATIIAPYEPNTYGLTFGTTLGTECTRGGVSFQARTTFSEFTVP